MTRRTFHVSLTVFLSLCLLFSLLPAATAAEQVVLSTRPTIRAPRGVRRVLRRVQRSSASPAPVLPARPQSADGGGSSAEGSSSSSSFPSSSAAAPAAGERTYVPFLRKYVTFERGCTPVVGTSMVTVRCSGAGLPSVFTVTLVENPDDCTLDRVEELDRRRLAQVRASASSSATSSDARLLITTTPIAGHPANAMKWVSSQDKLFPTDAETQDIQNWCVVPYQRARAAVIRMSTKEAEYYPVIERKLLQQLMITTSRV